jgi:hypothetical protein
MNYRSHFQNLITKLQRQLDDAMFREDWAAYLPLRHRMIEIKEHIVAHESRCGYDCDCEPALKIKKYWEIKDDNDNRR